ncbi:hypothetical protein GGR50DRAFT_186535 [Xylaria sp. CBS 124048]|nr:hypothetical protein GGR50DRAFT_186535 [Xylaria sp. CBS 124048]
MGSNLNNASSPPSDKSPSKPSLFSRLTAPLRPRTRHLPDFHVRLKEPHRQYSAGDHVQGHVILSVVKPIRVTHLTVALHGYVRAFKNASAAAQPPTVNPAVISSEDRHGRYLGNGHASLFQDEVVLCGEGRLTASRWEFEFDLQFPDLELPSSIDFERGTIAYLVTATLTRPTAIAPVSSCEARVSLVERLDVGLVVPPRERKVFLQNMRRRPKKGKSVASAASLTTKGHPTSTALTEPLSDRTSTRAAEASNSSTTNLGNSNPILGSPGIADLPTTSSPIPPDVQSEISGESVISNNSASYSIRGADAGGESVGSRKGGREREITATVELLKGGCLPGDLLPIKIRVEHNRCLKSLHGIIVTLYRQGRVDYAPPLSSMAGLSGEDAKKLERDEYFPRSKTGLGGLSLSFAGSCSVFRKDLSQAMAPLIIDPATLTANITTAVRVPEDAFPSIRNVPGGLISFKYHVEVIVDLGGKLTGASYNTAQLQVPTRVPSSLSGRGTVGIDSNIVGNWHRSIIDTDHIRREKGVISVSFEVIVGTRDSSRSPGKAIAHSSPTLQAPVQGDSHGEEDGYDWQNTYNGDAEHRDEYNHRDFRHPDFYPPVTSPPTAHYGFQPHETQAPIYVPPPDAPGEANLTDKERVRQAEERLLPSQPYPQHVPAEAGPSQISAPAQSSHMAVQYTASFGAEVEPLENSEATGEPTAPTLESFGISASEHREDDKQEIERRRLMAEASAPPDIPDDYHGAESSVSRFDRTSLSHAWSQEPSAPTLDENDGVGMGEHYQDIMGRQDTAGPSEPLPRYER